MYCNFPACRSCCQTFILNENTHKCMNTACEKEWTRKFIVDAFPNSFITGPLKKHRENILFDRERALLPATQPYAEAITQIKNNEKELLNINKMIKELNDRKNELVDRIQFLKLQPVQAVEVYTRHDVNIRQERRKFIKPCPVNECRGFLSSQWKCGLCDTSTCPDCHIVIDKNKNEPHTCDPNNVESAKMLKAETKPCPKCASSIFKIDGCDQMWCTQCHTAFSWKNGTIEKRIHNPHYYEWIRKTQGSVPRDPNDILHHNCDVAIGHNTIYVITRIIQNRVITNGESDIINAKRKRNLVRKLTELTRQIIHFEEVVIRDTTTDYEEKNRNLRIKYLMNEITEDMFKSKLQQADKKHNKKTEEINIYRLVSSGSSDIIRRFIHYIENTTGFETIILDEIKPLIKYANECTADIHKTYGGKMICFNEMLSVKSI